LVAKNKIISLRSKREMEHKLHIENQTAFSDIVSGIKVVETRLFDEKRKQYKVGDILKFSDGSITISKTIDDIVHYPSVRKLIEAESLEAIFPSLSSTLTIDDALKKYYNEFGFSKEIEEREGCIANFFH
jgi:ASC-1-like (ASCH) protein